MIESKSAKKCFIICALIFVLLFIIEVIVYCLNYDSISIDEDIVKFWLLFGLSIPVLVGIPKGIVIWLSQKKRVYLEENGKVVIGKIEWIKHYGGRRTHGFPFYQMLISYESDGKLKLWTSPRYEINPEDFVACQGKCKIMIKGPLKCLALKQVKSRPDNRLLKAMNIYYDKWWIISRKVVYEMWGTVTLLSAILLSQANSLVFRDEPLSFSNKWYTIAFIMKMFAVLLISIAIVWPIVSRIKIKQYIKRQDERWK